LIDAVQVKRKWNFGADSAAGARRKRRIDNPPQINNLPHKVWNLRAEKGNQF
jgi:hypothetical protein